MKSVRVKWDIDSPARKVQTFSIIAEKDKLKYVRPYSNNASMLGILYETSLFEYLRPLNVGAFKPSELEKPNGQFVLSLPYSSLLVYKAKTLYKPVERLYSVIRALHDSDIVHRQIGDESVVKLNDPSGGDMYAFFSFANFAFLEQDPVPIHSFFSSSAKGWSKKDDIIDLAMLTLRIALNLDNSAFFSVKNLLKIDTRLFFSNTRYQIYDHDLYNLAKFIIGNGFNNVPNINQICNFMGMPALDDKLGTIVMRDGPCNASPSTMDILNSSCNIHSDLSMLRAMQYYCMIDPRVRGFSEYELAVISKKIVIDLFSDTTEKDCVEIETIHADRIRDLYNELDGKILYDIRV